MYYRVAQNPHPKAQKKPWGCRFGFHNRKVLRPGMFSWWTFPLFGDDFVRPDTIWFQCTKCGIEYEERASSCSFKEQTQAQNMLNEQEGISIKEVLC